MIPQYVLEMTVAVFAILGCLFVFVPIIILIGQRAKPTWMDASVIMVGVLCGFVAGWLLINFL